MKHAKRIAALCLAAALFLTGCASGASGSAAFSPENPVTVTVWHYYNGPQQQAFADLVNEFNETVGREKGIAVQQSSQATVTDLETSVLAAANREVGAPEVPNIFAAYADTAYAVDRLGLVADLRPYLTDEELAEYVPGYLEEGAFSGEGDLIYFVDQDGESTAQSYSGKDLTDKPAIVLMDSGSASASEIFAGGVLGTGSGIVIGTRSYGKGVAQVLYDESNCPYLHGDAVKVTAYRFYCAGGNTTDRIGVVPTLYIPQDQAVAAARLLSGEKTKDSAYLRLVLNGCDFYIDIPAGKESSSAALEAILAALTPDAVLYWGENGGERKLTLAQAREKCGFAASSALDFSDVADSEYAQEIDSLAASRIVFGDGGKFRPDATMTRAEVCALLAQALDLYSTANGYFSDVAKGSWYAPSVNAMAAIGLVSGVGGGKFDPNATMTQEEFITVLGRLVEFVNLDAREFLDKNPLAILQPLPKYKSFSHWAIRSAELLTNSVFDENGDAVNMYCMSLEDIEPQVPILREQAAAALYNALRTTGVLKY